MANIVVWDGTKTAVYLAILSETGLKLRAATMAGVDLELVEYRKKSDVQFRTDCEKAEKSYQELLVEELDRRARKGVKKNVYFKGKIVGSELQFSDKCLELALKAKCPEFRERGIGIEVAQGGVLVIGVPELDNVEWRDKQNAKLEKRNCKQIGHEGDNST